MVFEHRSFDDHEQVLFCNDPSVGLQAIIAIHDTSLGPAAGGCRMQPYVTVDDALDDVLRLARRTLLRPSPPLSCPTAEQARRKTT